MLTKLGQAIISVPYEEHDETIIYVPLKKHCLEMDSLHPYTHAYKTLRSHHFPVPRGTRWDHYFRAPKQNLSGDGQSAALHTCLKML